MMQARGRLIGLGVGPGDPELITVRGLRLLQGARTVFVPVAEVSEASVAERIAAGLLLPVPVLRPNEAAVAAMLDAGGNLGFARANNIGIRSTTGELVLLLNPDTRVTPHAIDTLVAYLDAHAEAAAAGPGPGPAVPMRCLKARRPRFS